MKTLLFGFIAALMTTVSFGQKKESNVELALQKTLMVGTVEMLQQSSPAGTTLEDFNKQLTEAKVTVEGKLFLNKAFEFYKKGTSTKDILMTYDGKESKELLIKTKNGGVNPFGELGNPDVTGKEGRFWAWLRRTMKHIREFFEDLGQVVEAYNNSVGALQEIIK